MRTPSGERPPGRAAGTQKWRRLAFVHWEVDPSALARQLPAGLEVDEYRGRAFIGVVPFEMRAIRSSWMPRFLGLDFLETNVRCYVRCEGEPGVFFFSLEASSWLAVKVARAQWGLDYHHARMSLSESDGIVEAISTRRGSAPASLRLRYRVGDALGPSDGESLEYFLLERYLLFCERRGVLLRGQVHHAPYPVAAAELLDIEQDLTDAAGVAVDGPPVLIHAASGVDVEVFAPSMV